MAIGTSLGAYFETPAHHLAGVENNVIDPDTTPDIGTQDQNIKRPPQGPTEPAGALKRVSGTQVAPEDKTNVRPSNEPVDYDYDAWQKANPGVEMAPGQHYPDTYKLPNHMTFSDESMYHGGDNLGGHWGTDEQGKDTFTPGPTNLKNHTMSELQDYFKRVEPDAKLLPPDINDVPHHDWVENVFKAAKDAFKLPGDVFGGKIDPTSQQGIEKAAELAGFMTFGPAPVAERMAEGTFGSFMGSRASKTFDKAKAMEATQLEKAGVHPDEIWDKTGTARGADMRWRQEIDDSQATLNPDWVNGTPRNSSQALEDELSKTLGPDPFRQIPFIFHEGKVVAKLPEILDHPELYKAYPHLKDTDVVLEGKGNSFAGRADSSNNAIHMDADYATDKPILMHEVQHLIQSAEGFAHGGSPAPNFALRFEKEVADAQDTMNTIYKKKGLWSPEDLANWDKASKLLRLDQQRRALAPSAAEENYRLLSGEVEARNVANRAYMNQPTREIFPPQWTEDRPRSLQKNVYEPAWTTPYGPTLTPRKAPQYSLKTDPEEIKSAALQYKGQTVEGQNHGFALGSLLDKHGDIPLKDVKDGFTTTHGRFISREEAFQLAAQRQQIDSKVMRAYKENDNGKYITSDDSEPMLLSEDLK